MRQADRELIAGWVRNRDSGEGIAGVSVEAWDGDRFVARVPTRADGRFEVGLPHKVVGALFEDRPPALTVRIVAGDEVLDGGKKWTPRTNELRFAVAHTPAAAAPTFLTTLEDWDPDSELKLGRAEHPLPSGTLGTVGAAVEVTGPDEFPETLVRLPYSAPDGRGLDPSTARVFRWDPDAGTLRPVWNSGVNVAHGFVWAKIQRPGVLVTIALPSDKLLLSVIASMAYARRCADAGSAGSDAEITGAAFASLLDAPEEAIERLRGLAAELEKSTGVAPPLKDVIRGRGGRAIATALPADMSLTELRERLRALETPAGGLPEEQLLHPPEIVGADESSAGGSERTWKIELRRRSEALGSSESLDLERWWPGLFDRDWWMYQASERHSGHASGWSPIRSTNVNRLVALPPTSVAGPVYTKPTVVDGKIYVGSTETFSTGGTLYKIDLRTGNIDGRYETPQLPATYGIRGIGGSPAVVDDKVIFTSIHGRVYCLDTTTMSNASPPPPALWITDLKHADPAHNQPVENPDADCWSGPLVVNGNVYVGCGEGETTTACGFVYCLDADTGDVRWLFCTNQFQPGVDNQPNVIPQSLIPPPGTLPAGFTAHPDPLVRGASVWSSLAYCREFDRVYVGTGNPSPDTPAPDALYSSGCLSLDATTGEFKGFWQPTAAESYWPLDNDIDVPGGPIVYRSHGHWHVAIGSKSGAFVILDARTMATTASRQILPRQNGDGTPATPGTPLPSVVPFFGFPAENHYGVYGTPAHSGHRLFVSMGSDDGIPAIPDGLGDPHKTPFMRTMDDRTLRDAWPTTTDAFGITRYSNTKPPMYSTSETGLGSAAVVNDVVFACTGLAGASIYAFEVQTGLPLWADHPPVNDYCLGAAIYGNYVVIGAGSTVQRYVLHHPWFP